MCFLFCLVEVSSQALLVIFYAFCFFYDLLSCGGAWLETGHNQWLLLLYFLLLLRHLLDDVVLHHLLELLRQLLHLNVIFEALV